MPPMMLRNPENNLSIFDEIRAGFAFVAARARHVIIDAAALEAYAHALPLRHPVMNFDADHHFIGTPESTAAYVLTLDAVNFGSGYQPHLVREGWTMVDNGIYFTLATRLKKRFEQGGVNADYLSRIKDGEVATLFALPPEPYGQELARIFTQGLNDIGTLIARQYNGSFFSFVESANGKAANIIRQLSDLPQFYDVHSYDGKDIPLFKRAQSAAADLHDAFRHMGITLFSDIDQVTVLTDNDVPCVMRTDGLLRYAPELAQTIESGQELISGSPEEIEIRACTGYVAERLAAIKGVNAIAIDRVLWHRAAEDACYTDQPRHCTRSTFY